MYKRHPQNNYIRIYVVIMQVLCTANNLFLIKYILSIFEPSAQQKERERERTKKRKGKREKEREREREKSVRTYNPGVTASAE